MRGMVECWLFDNPLRAIGVLIIAFGLVLTWFCLKKKHEKTKAINLEFVVRSIIHHPMTVNGEPANPTRSISFPIDGRGRVSGTIESLDGTQVRLDVRRQTVSAKDMVVLEHSANIVKGPFDFSRLQAGDYELTIESDKGQHKVKIDCIISDETKPYEKYLTLAVAIVTSGVVILMKGL
jgi:hypothetical protein